MRALIAYIYCGWIMIDIYRALVLFIMKLLCALLSYLKYGKECVIVYYKDLIIRIRHVYNTKRSFHCTL